MKFLNKEYQIDEAVNGAEAIQKLEAAIAADKPFDAVLMDLVMPVMGGKEAMQMIRSKRLPVKVIAVTANASEKEECTQLFHGFLTKPAKKEQVVRMIEELVPLASITRKNSISGGTHDRPASPTMMAALHVKRDTSTSLASNSTSSSYNTPQEQHSAGIAVGVSRGRSNSLGGSKP